MDLSRDKGRGAGPQGRGGNAPEQQVFTSSVDEFLAWGKENSLFYLLFATACCGIELMQTGGPRYDVDRLGMIPRATPRQADLMIVAGTITHKMASRVRTLWEQMTEPRWVVSMGSCANSGGPFSKYSYSVLNGVDKYVPVDIYIPGCPPRPEALIDGVMALRERVRKYRTLGVRDRDPHVVQGGDCQFGSHPGKPAASDQRPAASGQQPAASDQRPAASGQQPAASDQQPAASGQQPAASGQQPATSDQRPAANSQVPPA